ncbi:hypothetical protein DY000_02033966 [Brassica cretica]|uniref:UDP-glucose/GDP-mannose dehydrogenase N-terminal domain-containing protein n=1 Tax=Brassica cretica TaxID=69181 RepID=A0ABQ7DR15_BRACR|nr:hypothetical protein DY000_02033966 [Brassica cretica]
MVKIYCIGGGYVGGPTIAVIALKCPHMYIVGVVDISVLPINAWNSDQGRIQDGIRFPIYEPGLEDIFMQCRNKNLIFKKKEDEAEEEKEEEAEIKEEEKAAEKEDEEKTEEEHEEEAETKEKKEKEK